MGIACANANEIQGHEARLQDRRRLGLREDHSLSRRKSYLRYSCSRSGLISATGRDRTEGQAGVARSVPVFPRVMNSKSYSVRPVTLYNVSEVIFASSGTALFGTMNKDNAMNIHSISFAE